MPDMPISASTLFHFTGTFANLQGILESNFHPRFVYEKLSDVFATADKTFVDNAVPMVCFCDIPLSQIHEHIEDYGSYGIGLSKAWATRMKLNPILYLTPDSSISDYLKALLSATGHSIKTMGAGDFDTVLSLYELMSHTKPYKGNLIKHGRVWKEKVFYNEKEWRYVPRLMELKDVDYRLSYKDYLDEEKRAAANARLAERAPLYFEPNDIRFIVVPDESEILPLLNEIEKSKGGKYNYNDVRMLSTKILTVDKIKEDF
jgi:hypothetical protein